MDQSAEWSCGDDVSETSPGREYTSNDRNEDDWRYEMGLQRDPGTGEWEKLNPAVLKRIDSTGGGLREMRHFLGVDMAKVKWNRDIVDKVLDIYLEGIDSEGRCKHVGGVYTGTPTENHFHVLKEYFAMKKEQVDATEKYAYLFEAREKLSALFTSIEDLATNLPDDFEQFREFRKKVKTDVDTFKKTFKKKFPIVIVGEMKCGKSTLINALIGEKLMYVDIKPATSYVCEIHNIRAGAHKRMELVDSTGGIVFSQSFEDWNNEDAVKRFVSDTLRKPRTDGNVGTDVPVCKVKLYWPMPLLPENVVLVDTPGVNEGSLFMSTVSTYLREEQQFCLCAVINSTTAAGDDTTKLIEMFTSSIKQACKAADLPDAEAYRLKSNLLKNCIFILNRWDLLSKRPPIQDSPDEPFFYAFSTWIQTFRLIEPILSELDLKGARVLRPEQLIPMSADNAYYASRLGLPSYFKQSLDGAISALAVRTQTSDLQAASDRLHSLVNQFLVGCNEFVLHSRPDLRDERLSQVNEMIEHLRQKTGTSEEMLSEFRINLIDSLRNLLTSGDRMREVMDRVAADVMNICAWDNSSESISQSALAQMITDRMADRLRPDITSIARSAVFESVTLNLELDDTDEPSRTLRLEDLTASTVDVVFGVSRVVHGVLVGSMVVSIISAVAFLILTLPFWGALAAIRVAIAAIVGIAIKINRLCESPKAAAERKRRDQEERIRGLQRAIQEQLQQVVSKIDNHWNAIARELSKHIDKLWKDSIWPQVLVAIDSERNKFLAEKHDLELQPSRARVMEAFCPLIAPLEDTMTKLSTYSLLGEIPSTNFIDPAMVKLKPTEIGGCDHWSVVFRGSFHPAVAADPSQGIPVAVEIIRHVDLQKDARSLLHELRVVRIAGLAPPEMWGDNWDPSINYSAVLKNTYVHFGGGVMNRKSLREFWPVIDEHLSNSKQSRDSAEPVDETEENVAYMISPEMHSNVARTYLDIAMDIPWKVRISACAKVAVCTAELHDQRLVHRDIKPEHFLIYGDSPGSASDKILMAGFAFTKDKKHTTGTICGHVPYFSPEQHVAMVKGKGVERRLLFKSDVYSTAVVILEILHGRPLARDANFNPEKAILGLSVLNLRSGRPSHISDIQGMLSNATAIDPQDRCNSRELATFFSSVVDLKTTSLDEGGPDLEIEGGRIED